MNVERTPHQGIQDEAQNCMCPETTWTKNIKGSHCYDWHSTLAVISFYKMFSGQFSDGVAPTGLGGRSHRCRSVLMYSKRIHSENLACRKIDKPFQTRALLQGL